jgi:hypothetical protein
MLLLARIKGKKEPIISIISLVSFRERSRPDRSVTPDRIFYCDFLPIGNPLPVSVVYQDVALTSSVPLIGE